MIIKYLQARRRGLVFYDAAKAGAPSMAPCWSTDKRGDPVDCKNVLVGVVGDDGLFRAHEAEPFDPRNAVWNCPSHGNFLLRTDA